MIDHHTYQVTWSAEDGEYLGLCLEFRSLSWLATDPGKAFHGIRDLVQATLRDMRNTGEKPPEPIGDRRSQIWWEACRARTPRDSPPARSAGGGRGSEPESACK